MIRPRALGRRIKMTVGRTGDYYGWANPIAGEMHDGTLFVPLGDGQPPYEWGQCLLNAITGEMRFRLMEDRYYFDAPYIHVAWPGIPMTRCAWGGVSYGGAVPVEYAAHAASQLGETITAHIRAANS